MPHLSYEFCLFGQARSAQEFQFNLAELSDVVKTLRGDVDKESELRHKAKLDLVLQYASPELKLALKAASEKGASSWVTAFPSYDHDTVLHKGDFTDAVYIRYGWELLNIPTKCVCGMPFNIQHALDCKLSGLRMIQHNEVRDVVAKSMREAGFQCVVFTFCQKLCSPETRATFSYG